MPWSERHCDWHVRLSSMPDPVHLLVFTRGDAPVEAGARRLGLELQALSRNVRLEFYDVDAKPLLAARYGIKRTPAFALLLGGVTIEDARIRCYGLPAGSLRQAFVAVITAVGRSRACLAPIQRLPPRHTARPVHLQVLVPSGSTVDLDTLLRIHRLVSSNPRLDADIVCLEQFPDLAARYEAGTTMMVVIDDTITSGNGATLHQFLDAIAAATAGEPDDREVERMALRAVAGGSVHGSLQPPRMGCGDA